MPDWYPELGEEERDRIIEKIAAGIIQRRMETPAILFLEIHKPLTFFTSQSLIITSPLIAPLVGLERVHVAARLLESRDNVERLIRRIEEMAMERQTTQKG
jgi:hypothetical protein